MSLIISTQSNAEGISNSAMGQMVTDAVAAAAQTVTLGFAPRYIKFVNLTDGITDEWYDGMYEAQIMVNLRGINAKLDADGITGTNYASLWDPASADLVAMTASLAGVLAKLDADAAVSGTNFASLWTPTSATVAALKASINGLNAKLDADGGVSDSDYAATWNVSLAQSQHSVIAGDKTFELTNGIAVDGNAFTLTATTMVASKSFFWKALG
jgi:hypothetical protein